MSKWTIKEIVNITKGKLINGDGQKSYNNFSKDTRNIQAEDIYIGIKGENFDGNSFYQQAFSNGASACILESSYEKEIDLTNAKDIIIVDNSIKALKLLAEEMIKIKNIPIIAVTGSVGKTSTRDLIYSVVSKKYKVLKTMANYNNEIGLPLTVLNLDDHNLAVFELGMSGLNEISYLSKIIKPDYAIITNILPVHIEHLKTIDNVLKAKLEIIDGLKENGTLIYNNDNKELNNAQINIPNKITYGIDTPSDIQAVNLSVKNNHATFDIRYEDVTYNFELNIGTKAFVSNALPAIYLGLKLQIPVEKIKQGLLDLELTEGRLETIKLSNNITLINDAYNANTESMKNAIDYLVNSSKERKIAILGDILETGLMHKTLHEEVGEYVSKSNIDYLITIGNDAKYIYDAAMNNGMDPDKIKYFSNNESSFIFIKDLIKPNDTILLKASNGMKFVEIKKYLENNFEV